MSRVIRLFPKSGSPSNIVILPNGILLSQRNSTDLGVTSDRRIRLGDWSTDKFFFPPSSAARELAALFAIAVTSLARSAAVPKVPTVAESGYPGFDATNWFGAMFRSGTAKPLIDRMSVEIGRALQLPEVNDALARVGLTAGAMTPAEFDTFIRSEMQKNGRIVRSLKLKVE